MRPRLPTNVTPPIVVDLGKASRADVAQLRRGSGPLVKEVEEVLRLVRASIDSQGEKRVLPVVVIYDKD
jgi:hypothetical protein